MSRNLHLEIQGSSWGCLSLSPSGWGTPGNHHVIASGQSLFIQPTTVMNFSSSRDSFFIYHAVSYHVWLLAFTDTSKVLVTCFQNMIEGAVNVKAIACFNDSLTQQLNEADGVLWWILHLQIGAHQEPAHALGHYNGWRGQWILDSLTSDTVQPHEKRYYWNYLPRNLYNVCLPIRPSKHNKLALFLAFKGPWWMSSPRSTSTEVNGNIIPSYLKTKNNLFLLIYGFTDLNFFQNRHLLSRLETFSVHSPHPGLYSWTLLCTQDQPLNK